MLISILQELNTTSIQIEASWIVSKNGLTLAAVLPTNADQDRAGAMCSGMLSFAEKTAKDLARGILEKVSVIGDKGCVLLANAGKEAILAVLTKPDTELETLFLDVDCAVEKLKALSAASGELTNAVTIKPGQNRLQLQLRKTTHERFIQTSGRNTCIDAAGNPL